jgi:NIMA (never in mitosis gene a)-related kinase
MTRTVDFAKTLVGTPYYLSPELCENKPYNHKSDVWSLGCVVYEMMTGSHPFNAQNQGALFIKILKGKYAPVRTPAYSHDLKELMDRCLTVNQTRRPDTVSILQSRAAHAKARTLGLELPGDVPAPGPGLGSENNQPDDLEVAKRAAAQQRRAATAVGSSRGPSVRDVKPMETRQQIIDRVKSARVDGTDRLPPRTDGFRVAGYGGAGGLAYAAARMADQSNARRPSTALPGGGTVAARSAAVIAGIAAAAAGGGVKGSAAAESELRRIRADSARLAAKAEGAAQNRAAAADAARGAEDEAARRRKEAGDAMRAARERRRQAEEEERIKAKAAAERQRERVATAAAAAEESRAKLMAAKAKLAEKRAGGRAVQSARGIGGYDASRYETDKTPPQKTALPPSPLQGLAVATGAPGTAHRRAPSSRKPVAANPGTVAVARPVSAVGVGVQSRPQSAAERREAARVVDADLVAALPESPGGVGTSSRHVTPVDVVTVDVPEFDEARAMAEIAARHVPPRVPVRNTGTVSNLSVPNLELSVSRSPVTPTRSRPRTAAGRGVVDVAKARRDAATASRAAIRLAKSPNPSSSRPASAFVRRTEDIFAGGPRGGGTKVVTEGDSPPLASDSRLVPVVSSYAEAHEQKMKANEDRFDGTAASAIGVARAAAVAVNQFVASTRTDSFGADDGAGMESSGTFSGTFSAEELGRVAAETAAAARAAASIASGSSRSDRSSSFDRPESSPRVDANAAQIPNYHPITDETRTRDGETNGGVPAFVFGNASSRGLSTDTFASDEGTRTSPGSVDRGAVARALRATVKALESALGPPDEATDSDSGDEAIDSQLKPFYDDDGGSESESEPASTPSTPRSGTEYYSGSDSEERFVRIHGASRGERVEELVSEMSATEEAAVAIVGAESFGLLYDFLAKKSEAADDGRLNRPGTPGKVRALSERVFDIIPRDKTEAVTLAYRYMHLVEKLQDLE